MARRRSCMARLPFVIGFTLILCVAIGVVTLVTRSTVCACDPSPRSPEGNIAISIKQFDLATLVGEVELTNHAAVSLRVSRDSLEAAVRDSTFCDDRRRTWNMTFPPGLTIHPSTPEIEYLPSLDPGHSLVVTIDIVAEWAISRSTDALRNLCYDIDRPIRVMLINGSDDTNRVIGRGRVALAQPVR